MKILFATDTYPPHANGTAYFVYRLAHQLAARGHTVSIIAPSETFANTKTFDNAGVTVYGMRSVPYLNYPKFRMSFWPILSKRLVGEIVSKTSPDIVHIQAHFPIGAAVAKVAKIDNIPVIGTNHYQPENLIHYLPLPEFARKIIIALGWKWFKNVYNNLDAVTTPTETAAKIVKGIGFNKPIIVISNGISLKHFKPKETGSQIRKKYNIPLKKPVLLFVGRLDKEKLLDVVIDAMPQVIKSCDIQFVAAGVGADRAKLEKLSRDLKVSKHVTFTGFVADQDLPNLYRTATAFVMLGISELQGIAIMEAMATGLPILAANAKALPELVNDSENGYLIEPGDSKTLGQKIIIIFTNNNLQQKMSAASLKIIKVHDLENTISRFEKLYQQVVKRHQTKK